MALILKKSSRPLVGKSGQEFHIPFLHFIKMSSFFKLGQVLKGKFGEYIVSKELQDTVWFAKYVYTSFQRLGALTSRLGTP